MHNSSARGLREKIRQAAALFSYYALGATAAAAPNPAPAKLDGRTKAWLWLIALVSAVLSFYYQGNQWVSGDQFQMLNKGFHAALTGEYLPYGNEASTMGNVPGSLSSILIGLPLSLWFNPYAPVIALELIRLLGYALFVNAIVRLFDARTVLFGALIYALNPWFLYDSLLYNPSYLSFGAALVLNMLVRLRKAPGMEQSFWQSFACSMFLTLGVGWCLQLHFSWPVLVALTGLMWLLRAIRFNFAGAAAGLALLGLSLVPYFQEIQVNDYITSNPTEYAKERYFGYGLVHVYPLFKALLYWLRFGSLLVTNKALPELGAAAPLYQEALSYLWLFFTQLVGVISVLFAALVNYRLIFRSRHSQDSSLRFCRALTISALGALLLAAAAATLTLNYWQIIVLFCFALLPLLSAFNRHPLPERLVAVLAVFMLTSNIISATSSEKFSYRADYAAAVSQYCLSKYDAKSCALTPQQAQELQGLDLTPPRD